jgi:hypothetical protein
VRLDHIHEALREFAGIATHAHAKKFPLGLTEKEKLKWLWGGERGRLLAKKDACGDDWPSRGRAGVF